MDNLTESMRNACLDGELPEPGQLLFEPQADSGLPKIALDNLPRYLFRIATRESDGETNEVWVRSESALSKHRDGSPPLEDIFHYLDDEKRKVIARTLNFHLRWWPKRGKRGVEDNFVSWTSSLLFAIQYIYYRHLEAKKMSKLEDIKLYVIDTTLFHRGTFLRDMDLIDAFCEFDDHRDEKNLKSFQSMRNKPEYYFGEYLSQGSLKIQDKCQVIPATVLFENGRLNRLQPHFADIRSLGTGITVNWAKEVVRLREAIWPAIAPHDLSASDLVKRFQAAREIICHHVAPAWRLPLAIYFTALIGTTSAKLEHEENADDSTFFAHFHSFPFPETRTFEISVVAPETMPELKQVEKVAVDLHKQLAVRGVLDCLTMAELEIENLYNSHILSEDVRAFDAEHNTLEDDGRRVLSTLHKVRMLREKMTRNISRNEQ